jgi:hypothetical protein
MRNAEIANYPTVRVPTPSPPAVTADICPPKSRKLSPISVPRTTRVMMGTARYSRAKSATKWSSRWLAGVAVHGGCLTAVRLNSNTPHGDGAALHWGCSHRTLFRASFRGEASQPPLTTSGLRPGPKDTSMTGLRGSLLAALSNWRHSAPGCHGQRDRSSSPCARQANSGGNQSAYPKSDLCVPKKKEVNAEVDSWCKDRRKGNYAREVAFSTSESARIEPDVFARS